MFNPKKFTNNPGSSGALVIVIAAVLTIVMLSSLLTSGTALFVIGGILVLFGLWWLYDRFRKPNAIQDELSKYRKALAQQKKKNHQSATRTEGNVIYIKHFKRR